MFCNEISNDLDVKGSSFSHATDLKLGGRRADMGIEPTA
jgi:hypothetical protein